MAIDNGQDLVSGVIQLRATNDKINIVVSGYKLGTLDVTQEDLAANGGYGAVTYSLVPFGMTKALVANITGNVPAAKRAAAQTAFDALASGAVSFDVEFMNFSTKAVDEATQLGFTEGELNAQYGQAVNFDALNGQFSVSFILPSMDKVTAKAGSVSLTSK